MSTSSDLLDLLLQEDACSGTGSAASASGSSGSGSNGCSTSGSGTSEFNTSQIILVSAVIGKGCLYIVTDMS